jgi:molecular chaperone DnaJ
MPRLGNANQRGDLYAEVHVRVPERLTDRQRELIEEFARLETGDGADTDGARSVGDRVRDIYGS